jgi:hypothetical protein
MHVTTPLAALGVVSLLLTTAACSSDSGPSTSTSGHAATDSRPRPARLGGSSTTATPSRLAGPGDVRRTCTIVADNTSVLLGVAGGLSVSDLRRQVGVMRTLASAAPASIRAGVTVVADFDQHLLDEVTAGGRPNIAETPKLHTALTRIVAWTAAHCR